MTAYRGRTCSVCSTTYDATYSAQRTCGRACGAKIRVDPRWNKAGPDWPVTRIWLRDCMRCGSPFIRRTNRGTYCKRGCAKDALLERRRATKDWGNPPRKNPPHHPCESCNNGSLPWPRHKCDACLRVTHRARKLRDKRRRRALRLGIESEPYTLAEIAARDRYRCGLCRGKVDMRLAVPHLGAPTIDHVLPLANGGSDKRINVQLAHFSCNSRKRNLCGFEQLALIG